MNQSDNKHVAHDSDPETHKTLLRIVQEQYQASDYKIEIAGGGKRDVYAKALLETGSGEGRKAYFKVDGRQRLPTILVLNGQLLAKWEIAIGQKYRVYVPGGGHSATLKPE
jgi:hypothetical protein